MTITKQTAQRFRDRGLPLTIVETRIARGNRIPSNRYLVLRFRANHDMGICNSKRPYAKGEFLINDNPESQFGLMVQSLRKRVMTKEEIATFIDRELISNPSILLQKTCIGHYFWTRDGRKEPRYIWVHAILPYIHYEFDEPPFRNPEMIAREERVYEELSHLYGQGKKP